MFIKFNKISGKNFMSIGNTPLEFNLNTHNKNMIVGKNGVGKCLRKSTKIDIDFDGNEELEKLFLDFLSDL